MRQPARSVPVTKGASMSDHAQFYPSFVYSDLKEAMAWLEKAFGFRTLMAVPNEDGS